MTVSRKNIRVCNVLYSGSYYDVLLAVDNLDEVDNALQEWATNKFGVTNPLSLPEALIYNKDITEIITNLDIDNFAYLQSTSGVSEYSEITYLSDEIDLKTGLTDQGACTFSNASGSLLCTDGGHSMVDGDPIQFTTTGSLPTGLAINKVYYVRDATADTFKLTTTKLGSAIAYSDAGSGVHNSWKLNKITISLTNGKMFIPTRFGTICTTQDGTVSSYPTIRYHASDLTSDLESPVSHTGLTAKGKFYKKDNTGADAVNLVNGNELMGDITVAGAQSAGSIYKGKIFFSGLLITR